MKNSKCAISNKHIQDGRPGTYENHRRTPKNVQTDHPAVTDTRTHSEEAEKRVKPSVVPYHPGNCRKRPSRIKVQPVSGSLQELRTEVDAPLDAFLYIPGRFSMNILNCLEMQKTSRRRNPRPHKSLILN